MYKNINVCFFALWHHWEGLCAICLGGRELLGYQMAIFVVLTTTQRYTKKSLERPNEAFKNPNESYFIDSIGNSA